jgi:hypothetical protein
MDALTTTWVIAGTGALIGVAVLLLALRSMLHREAAESEDVLELTEVYDEGGHALPDGPLKRAIQRSFETGKPVIWNDGDALP